MAQIRRKNIMSAPFLEKERVYEEIHKLYKSGVPVSTKQHWSGFPAMTIDCGDIHIRTDCLSVEEWWAKVQKEGRD